jgi:hypothetical protein
MSKLNKLASLLSKMYYGEEGSVALSTRGDKKVAGTFLQTFTLRCFYGMQEIRNYLTRENINQGLSRRIFQL